MSLRTLKNSLFALVRKSDHKRWSNIANHDTAWSGRTVAMSKYVRPGESVFEFGAGRCHLREMLPAGSQYTPSDIVERDAGTYVCDLNARPLPAFPKHDIGFCSGVLEYVYELDEVVASFAKSFNRVIASYADLDRNPSKKKRLRNGWFNHLTRRKFLGCFEAAGYSLQFEELWERHGIYVFDLKSKFTSD